MEQSIVRKKLLEYLEETKMSKFQTSEEILVLEKDEEIQAILEARSLPEEYREIMLEYLHSLKRIAERSK